jgi:MoxR-like ATPase
MGQDLTIEKDLAFLGLLENDFKGMLQEQMRIPLYRECLRKLRHGLTTTIIDQPSKQQAAGTAFAMDMIIDCMIANELLLLTGPRGTGKTRLLESLAMLIAKNAGGIRADFVKVQVTGGLRPSHVAGGDRLNPETGRPEIYWGPFPEGDVILIDELTRGIEALYNALLEVTDKKKLSFAGETKALRLVSLIVMSRNPKGARGTNEPPPPNYDRIGVDVLLEDLGEDNLYLMQTERRYSGKLLEKYITPAITLNLIAQMREEVEKMQMDQRSMRYISRLVAAMNPKSDAFLKWHASERVGPDIKDANGKTIKKWNAEQLAKVIREYPAARTANTLNSLLRARSFRLGEISDKDIKDIFPAVCRHRTELEEGCELTAEQFIRLVLERVTMS